MSNGVEVLVRDKSSDGKQDKTKYMEIKTIQPSVASNIFLNNIPKIDKKIDSEEENSFDVIQPSEVNHASCTTSCSCSHTQTEMLKTKYTNNKSSIQNSEKHNIKTSKFSGTNVNIKPTHKNVIESTLYHPYEYESSSQAPPTDKIVEKYTQVNDYSDEKDSNSVENSDLLTNEQAPLSVKNNKVQTNKTTEKIKPEKPQKINKNKFVVAELIKLGSLGIKGLSQLAPVIEKMTGGFMKRQEINKTIPSSTTFKPPNKVTSYNANKRVDNDIESKVGNFPIYIPVDEMEVSESQIGLTNVTLHQNFAWAAEHKNPVSHLIRPKIVHESPLVNGGIPISPGEIITANSDVIVGKPAVGGPLTLVASGIKLQNNVHPPLMDSVVANNELYVTKEKPLHERHIVDDSFDLRPPQMPKGKPQLNYNLRPQGGYTHIDKLNQHSVPSRSPSSTHPKNEYIKQAGLIKPNSPVVANHGRPTFLDYIPPISKISVPKETQVVYKHEQVKDDIPDSNPSSSEIVSTKITTNGEYAIIGNSDTFNKPLLVDIQPSRVANVLIPHGSSTALVFAGSSEPHKTGDYVDDPLPYPEPGYFGSFSIDAPQMTNVHNVVPNKNQFLLESTISTNSQKKSSFSSKESGSNTDPKVKWNDHKYSGDLSKIPPPTSSQETYVRVGPQITVYNPEIYKDFEKYQREKKGNNNLKEGKGGIDKEYENYLAVPPPPPQLHLNQNIPYDKNKYQQRPIIHKKPILDNNVFLSIQNPVSNQLPLKVTSEIYFASQMPNNYPTPTYTINMPPPTIIEGAHPNLNPSNQFKKSSNTQGSSKTEIKSNLPTDNRENTYTVTLNTAANVAGESATGHIVGSSISVPITTTSLNGQINADIPIGTNFAIRVEDDPAKYESVAMHGKRHPSLIHDDQGHVPFLHTDSYKHRVSDGSSNITNTFANQPNHIHKNIITNKKDVNVQPPTLNSHANFPIINEDFNKQQDPYPSYPFSIPNMNTRPKLEERPSQFLPNVSTNSHGWYASVLNEENLKNIKLDVTTRKIIPLKYDVNSDNLPKFGEKIATVGKPPTEFWNQSNKRPLNHFKIGKPFSKAGEVQNPHLPSINAEHNYIPSILNNDQKAYDIPTKEHSYETSSIKSSYLVPSKTIYETADEIYDGEDGSEYSELDSEVSSESMKVPIITSSKKVENINKDSSTNITANDHKKLQDVPLVNYNSGSQTEKPFTTQNRTSFHSNSIKPIYGQNIYTKPRPFTPNSNMPLDHQLQQPHWQINQLMENATNISYEDNMDLNIGEEIYISSTSRTITTRKPSELTDTELTYHKQQKPFSSNFNSSTRFGNGSNIITSTVHIQDKKPLLLEVNEKSTIPVFTIRDDLELNISSSEIIDLSPPPPMLDNNFKIKLSTMQEIMGMSPPPPRTSPPKYTSKAPATPRPVLPGRTSPPYRTLPPRTLQPKQSTQRPLRKPINKDDISTYRPTFDIVNKIKRPYINRDQPSSHLLPPPRDIPSAVASIDNMSMLISSVFPTTSVIFPTPVSTSWLISSNIEFPTNADNSPTSVYFPDAKVPPETVYSDIISLENSSENIFNSNEYETSSEIINVSYEKPITQKTLTMSQHYNRTRPLIEKESDNISSTETESREKENISSETSQVNVNKDRLKVTIGNKNRTRKPYPLRGDDKKTVTNRFKPPSKIIPIIKPTRTLSRPEISHPTRHTSVKKIVRPIPSRPLSFIPTSVIESSESSLEEDFVRPTEVLNENQVSTLSPQLPSVIEKTITSTLTVSQDISDKSNIHKTHYAGNEIKISDEIIPTKTEFKTTIITLTKTLSEPPQIISSIGYVNLTHTLTVTHTETSLVSQSEGAITETLVLTNIQTSTVVDVVTEVYTQVQPTTIVETVTKHVPIPQVEATPVLSSIPITKVALDDISMSSEESDNFIIKDEESNATENIQKIDVEEEKDNDTFFVVMNKSQNGGKSPPISTDIDTGDYDGITRNEQVNNNGVSQVLFGEILLAGTPYSETTNVGRPIGAGYGKECQPDCKASRNERCQRIEGVMKCVCRPGFARMFPDRPCKPTYTYSVRLALGYQGKERLKFHSSLSDNSTKEYHSLAVATHEGINRMVMQSDLRDVYHGVHITGFYPIEIKPPRDEPYTGVINDFYVQLSDNAHESRLKEVIEKYLRNNNYSLGGTQVHAAEELMDRLNVSDFDECISTQFHDCSEHARCFNLRGTYTCSCMEGFADLSVNTLYPGRICSSDAVGCGGCNYHGTCFERESAMFCECFKWYAGRTCQVNLKAVLITVTVVGAVIILAVTIWASKRCCSPRSPATQTFVIGCMQGMPNIHQGNMPSKQRADRRALITERMETAETGSVQNASLPYIPSKSRSRSSCSKKITVISDPPAHAPPPPPPAPALMIPRARLHPLHSDSRDNLSRKKSTEICSEAKLISYLESGVTNPADEMRRKHSMESSYSINKERSGKQGALVSAGFKVSTTIRPDDSVKEDRDDTSSVNKTDLEDASRFDTLRKTYSQEDMSEWTDAERRIGELTLSEARSVGGTLPASTGRAASSTRLTHQEANTMAERDLGSTFLLPHVHLYKPDLTSDVSEFDSL